jgi:hypothetical protein
MHTRERQITPDIEKECIISLDPAGKGLRLDRHRLDEVTHQCGTCTCCLRTAGEVIRGGWHIGGECPDELPAARDP